jgi:uncharacterized membrane protein
MTAYAKPLAVASPSRAKRILKVVLAALMVFAGVMHFVTPEPFVKIVPAQLPSPLALVYISGVFEILGGLGLLIRRTQRLAAWGLVALYVAVFPANINMAIHQISFDDAHPVPAAALWLRLPLQAVLIAWAWWLSRPERPRE